MQREDVIQLMKRILAKQDKASEFSEESALREIGFRSLDFSELVLRVEMETGNELSFDAAPLREITTVGDVLDFVEVLLAKDAG